SHQRRCRVHLFRWLAGTACAASARSRHSLLFRQDHYLDWGPALVPRHAPPHSCGPIDELWLEASRACHVGIDYLHRSDPIRLARFDVFTQRVGRISMGVLGVVSQLVFFLIAGLTLIAGVMTVTLRNVFHAGLALVGTFFGVAA